MFLKITMFALFIYLAVAILIYMIAETYFYQ